MYSNYTDEPTVVSSQCTQSFLSCVHICSKKTSKQCSAQTSYLCHPHTDSHVKTTVLVWLKLSRKKKIFLEVYSLWSWLIIMTMCQRRFCIFPCIENAFPGISHVHHDYERFDIMGHGASYKWHWAMIFWVNALGVYSMRGDYKWFIRILELLAIWWRQLTWGRQLLNEILKILLQNYLVHVGFALTSTERLRKSLKRHEP